MRYVALLICLLVTSTISVFAQEVSEVVIEGMVYDAETGDPLPGANVYVSGTTIGAATGPDGTYRITEVPVGPSKLVASMIGYAHQIRSVHVSASASKGVVFALNPRVVTMDEIKVTAEDADQWRRNLKRFKKLFFGTSRIADECEILNPLVLDFSYDEGKLRATARRPLEIVNHALGYRLTYYLTELRGNRYKLYYDGTVHFRKLTADSKDEASRWRENRRETYRGSLRHFLTALGRKRLSDEGFVAAVEPAISEQHGELIYGVEAEDIVAFGKMSAPDTLIVLDELAVSYSGELPSSRYRIYLSNDDVEGNPSRQYSSITVENQRALFDADGMPYYPTNIRRRGYWGWSETAATLLPHDYEYIPPERTDGDAWWKIW